MKNLLPLLFCLLIPCVSTANPVAAYDVLGDGESIEYVQVCEGGVCRLVPVQRAVNAVRNVADKAIGLDGDGGFRSVVLAYDVCGCGCGMEGCDCGMAAAAVSRVRGVANRAINRPLSFARKATGRVRNVAHRAIFHRRR